LIIQYYRLRWHVTFHNHDPSVFRNMVPGFEA
jgi:hypothetical protein